MPSEYQLTDLATKAQPEAVLIAQRESLMQWGAELKTREELDSMLTVELLPSCHLRACEIIEHAGSLISMPGCPSSKWRYGSKAKGT